MKAKSYSIWYHVPWDSKVLFRVVYLDGWMAGWLAGSEQNDGRYQEIDKMVGEHSSSLGESQADNLGNLSPPIRCVVFRCPSWSWSWMPISLSPAFVRLLD